MDERANSTYSVADITKDGDIFIVYDQGRYRENLTSGSEMLFARFSEEDIISGKLTSSRFCFKRLVARYGLPP